VPQTIPEGPPPPFTGARPPFADSAESCARRAVTLTLRDLERQLDPRRFVRIHRSFLLNLDRLARLEPTGKDSRMAILRDGRRLPVSRSGYARLQQLL
jgi:DNA-binding LytR/AlgR family response regulator